MYQKIKADELLSRYQKNFTENKQQFSKKNIKNLRCFKCGSTEHKKDSCSSGIKCFKCGQFGHIANKCTSLNQHKNLLRLRDVNVINKERRMKFF